MHPPEVIVDAAPDTVPQPHAPVSQQPKLEHAVARINAARAEGKSRLVERDEHIDMAWLHIVARQHMQLYGAPGVAKSLLVRDIIGFLTSVHAFEILMRKDLPTELLVGPLSLKGLENDEIRHLTDGMLPDVHIAFLDENFKANAVALNTLLPIVNERIFHNGRDVLHVPLMSCFYASNEQAQEEGLEAFDDRTAGRMLVEEIKTEESFVRVLDGQLDRARNGNRPPAARVDLLDLEVVQAAVPHVEVPEAIKKKLYELWKRSQERGLDPSLRRMGSGLQLGLANAVLNGRPKLDEPDLKVFQHVLFTDLEDKDEAAELCMNFADAAEKATNELRQAFAQASGPVDDIRQKLPDARGDSTKMSELFANAAPIVAELTQTRQTIQKKIEDLKRDGADATGLEGLLADVEHEQDFLRRELFG